MLRLSSPTLLTLSLAIPSASFALGLGDLRVDSALHQPFVGQIELIGATHDELGRLSAEVASEDVFERYGLERAPFVYGTTLVVGEDKHGRPVLNLRSTEKFTEPVVTLLVDLHTPNGELIREYTIFLDPPELASKPTGLESTSAAPATAPVLTKTRMPVQAATDTAAAVTDTAAMGTTAAGSAAAGSTAANATGTATTAATIAAPARALIAPATKLLGHTYTVARRDTLDHIVSSTGAHSRTDRHRMMIAIFRANPTAFQNNFNRLHTGVTLHFPTSEQLSTISAAEANREYDAQMAAWHTPGHRIQPAAPAPATAASGSNSGGSNSPTANSAAPEAAAPDLAAPNPAVANSIADAADTESQETDKAVLTQRVASLEKSLEQLRQELKQPLVVQQAAPVAVVPARAPEMDASQDEGDEEDEPAPHHGTRLVSIAAGIVFTLLAGAWFYRRRRTTDLNRPAPQDRQEVDTAQAVETPAPPLKTIPGPSLPGAVAQSEPRKADSNMGKNESSWFDDSFSTPIADLLANDPMASSSSPAVNAASEVTVELPVDSTAKLPVPVENIDTTVMLAPDLGMAGDTAEQKFSFFNPESTNNTEHVVMGSGLESPQPFVERRKNPVDVLRQAIEREPERSDLRLKLLELYYTAAAENRRAFLEATRQLAKNEKLASAEDWSRIADMGRKIAPDDAMFSADLDDKRVA
jgi:pilus assembly protein FimV